jgi:hypothetical protein
LGLKTDYVLNLPAGGKPQHDKVISYIESTRLAIVLISFDDSDPSSTQARPNVYNELTDCHRILKGNVLVLLEQRRGTTVEMPSNLKGCLVELYFERERVHKSYPQIIKELTSLGLLFPLHPTHNDSKVLRNRIVCTFLEKMDDLWINDFTRAWNSVYRTDQAAESDIAVGLDKFFQEAWHLFLMFAKGASDMAIQQECSLRYENSLKLAADAWKVAAEAKMAIAQDKYRAQSRSIHSPLYEKARSALMKANESATERKKIVAFKIAVELVEQFIKEKSRA